MCVLAAGFCIRPAPSWGCLPRAGPVRQRPPESSSASAFRDWCGFKICVPQMRKSEVRTGPFGPVGPCVARVVVENMARVRGTPPRVVKQDKPSRGSVDTKTPSDPQRVRMCKRERPIGAVKGKQTKPWPRAPPPPPSLPLPPPPPPTHSRRGSTQHRTKGQTLTVSPHASELRSGTALLCEADSGTQRR